MGETGFLLRVKVYHFRQVWIRIFLLKETKELLLGLLVLDGGLGSFHFVNIGSLVVACKLRRSSRNGLRGAFAGSRSGPVQTHT